MYKLIMEEKNPVLFVKTPTQLLINKLGDNVIVLDGYIPVYEDLFCKEVKKIIRIGQILNQKFARREEIVNQSM